MSFRPRAGPEELLADLRRRPGASGDSETRTPEQPAEKGHPAELLARRGGDSLPASASSEPGSHVTAVRIRRTAALLGLVVGLLAAGTASAATSLEVIAPPSAEPRTPDLAVNGAGRAVAVWTGRAPGGSGFAVYARIRLQRRGAWTLPERVSGIEAQRPLAPTVALGDGGGAVAIWRVPGGAVQSATLPAGSTTAWTRQTVAADGEGFVAPAISARPAIAVWADRVGTTWRARRAHLLDGSWQLAPPLDLSAAGLIPPGAPDSPPDLAVGARGDAAVIWPGPTGPPVPAAATRLSVALWPRGSQAWQPPVVLSEQGAHGDVALGPAGHAGAAWVEGAGSVRASVRDPEAGAWPAPDTLVAGQTATPAFPHIALNREGYAVASWGETEGDLSLRARTRSGASGVWGAERTVYDDFSVLLGVRGGERRGRGRRRPRRDARLDRPGGPGIRVGVRRAGDVGRLEHRRAGRDPRGPRRGVSRC